MTDALDAEIVYLWALEVEMLIAGFAVAAFALVGLWAIFRLRPVGEEGAGA